MSSNYGYRGVKYDRRNRKLINDLLYIKNEIK